ncbi:GNAT family N-acetyltransferase [Kribbella capetownensis]|uniref:GNAT family N-acetyltransferase n=1 Tax=Kribbella capetownensis TaxID=1572659 RepID=A0A4R0JUH9_9ACTN|nr:GNAT family N-acetyltransferase [Kribbella capetownensis]TCC50639.1 GNAT family N-acetyltransferase [Kribbella capetownensis]
MSGLKLTELSELTSTERDQALVHLVERIQHSPPYSYRTGEIRAASQWFPPLVSKSRETVIAELDERPVGYCVSLPIAAYGQLDNLLGELAVDPATTEYLAELGVDETVRRQGIASALLSRLHDGLPSATTAVLIRTLADNHPAIEFYRRQGYQLIDGVTQEWNGRGRIFLLRRKQTA